MNVLELLEVMFVGGKNVYVNVLDINLVLTLEDGYNSNMVEQYEKIFRQSKVSSLSNHDDGTSTITATFKEGE